MRFSEKVAGEKMVVLSLGERGVRLAERDGHHAWLAIVLMLVAVSEARAEMHVIRGATMGTTYQIKLITKEAAFDREQLHADVEQVLAEVDRQMSTYRPDSELSRFNRAPAGTWFSVSAATAEVVAAAREISEKTGGALDVTVGPLVQLWHHGPSHNRRGIRKPRLTPPTDADIAGARERVGYQKLEVRDRPPALRKLVEGLEVDLSSIAPGYTIDRLADLLSQRGIDNSMVEIGGEIRAAGRREDGKYWRVAVERPAAGPRELYMSLPLRDAAIATAGDYRKYFEFEGRRYSHVIDPATGRPMEHQLASVTVVADTCVAADGWDTPLLVLGPERGLECAEENDIAALFLSRGKDHETVRETQAWKEMKK
jgi:thiamine biosynthesis lipoprotein